MNGESKDDDADAVAAVGAERGDAAGADDTAVHADATGPSAEMEASETGTHTKTAETLAFRVNVCGIPPIMRQNQAPWPVCKVWLVGCPGGAPCGIRSGDLKDGDEGFKPAWTHRADMTPADPGRLSIFEHVTDALAPGDEFAFMIAKPSCSTSNSTPRSPRVTRTRTRPAGARCDSTAGTPWVTTFATRDETR